MTRELEARPNKARGFVDAAEASLARKDAERTVSHAYYAMLHAAMAMLLAKGVETSSRKEAEGRFGFLFAKQASTFRKFHRYLIDAAPRRDVADYLVDPAVPISTKEAMSALTKAREFVEMAEQFLKGAGGWIEP